MITGTAPESYQRVTELAKSLENPRHGAMLEVWRDHWWAEVNMDLETIMATLAPNPHYRIYGAQIFGSGIEIDTTEDARAIYAQLIDDGICPGGPFIDERFAFGSWGLMIESVFSVFMPGRWVSS